MRLFIPHRVTVTIMTGSIIVLFLWGLIFGRKKA